jgi:hypothetical protein
VSDLEGWRWYYQEADQGRSENWLASVTNILSIAVPNYLKNYMMRTSASRQEKRLVEASALGTKAHAIIESDLMGESIVRGNLDPIVRVIFDGWLKLKAAHKISAHVVEVPVGSLKYGFCGTTDIIGEFDGEPCVMDLKTGNYDKKAGLQLSAYREAWRELTGESLGMVGISIRARKALNGAIYADPNTFQYNHFAYCWSAFLSCFNTWKSIYSTKIARMHWKYRGLHAVPEAPWGN